MKSAKKRKLESRGWRVAGARDFLGLTPEEAQYIELKLALAAQLKKQRLRHRLTQVDLAKRVDSSQSRVAKMESGDPSVTLDLQIRSLLALGVSRKEISRWIGKAA